MGAADPPIGTLYLDLHVMCACRNVAHIPQALSELRRVLRPAASVAILDFNNSAAPATDAFQVPVMRAR